MTDSRLLIETFYFKQLLNEEVAFFNEYEPLLGDRTQEFFEHYRNGLNAQKELILALECVEISEKILQEKFGDQFAAKAAGLGAKARAGINKLATGGKLGGTLGNWVQNKFGVKGSTTDAGNEAYLKARNQNFIRSVGDYLGQLKTLDKTIPDKVGLVPVKMSGWAGGIWQKGKQLASGAADVAFAGTLFTPAMLTGTAFAGVGGAEKLLRKLNELFDAQWAKLQNLQPVQDFDRLFEVKKKIIRDRLSKIDSSGKETSTIINTIDALGKFGRENPVKSGIIIGLLTFVGGISAATLGLGALTITQFPLLVGAIAFFLHSGFELLTGASASSAVGSGVKAGIGTTAGSAVGGVAGAALSENNSLKLTDIVNNILSEADETPATSGAGPLSQAGSQGPKTNSREINVTPDGPQRAQTVQSNALPSPTDQGGDPAKPASSELTANQLKSIENLKFNIGKEISTYLKDIAKTFKVKGSSTSQLIDNLKKIPQAKSAIDILESLMAEFPKYKLDFPKDVVVDDKEAATPPTPATPDGGSTTPGGTTPGGTTPGGTTPGGTTPGGTTPGGTTPGGTTPGGTTPGGTTPGGTTPGGTTPGGTTPGGTTPGGTTPGGTTPGGTTPGGTTPGGTTPVVGSKTSLTPNDLRMVKAFLSKVYDLSLSVKAVDLNAPTKSKMRPVISNILDILDIATGKINPSIKINKKLDSAFQGIDITGQSIATPSPTPTTPVTEAEGESVMALNPEVKKQFVVIKSNPLISGDVVSRISNLMRMNIGDTKNIKYTIGLVSTIKDAIGGAATKAAIQKQLGGNIGQLRKTMLEEDINSGDIATIMKEIKALMPALISLTFGLRQATSSKNKTNKEGVVLKAKVGSVVYVFKYTNGKWFVRGKDKQFTEPVVDEKRINQLNDLAATGKNDADQVKKDDAGNVKSSDTDVKSTEKPDSEKDTSKVDDKSKIKETFKSEYKNYF
jgi:hypothetical protein